MPEINESAGIGVTQSASTAAANSALTSDFDTFLQLLTAQITNQDPLAPIDSTQFVEQLATFSSLEQQISTNTNLEAIVTLMQNSFGDQSTSLLGQQASAQSISVSGGSFDATSIATNSAEATGSLVVRNDLGDVVHRSAAGEQWSWDGTNTQGEAVPDGTYSFEILTPDGTTPAFMVSTIDRVVQTSNGLAVGFQEGVTATKYQLATT